MLSTRTFLSQNVHAAAAASLQLESQLVSNRAGWYFLKPRARKRVLLAEHNSGERAEIRSLLEAHGLAVFPCEDARSAVEMFRHSGSSDLLVADFDLPGMSGPELALELTRLSPDIPVLLLSQSPLPSDVRLMLNQCGWHSLAKPFAAAELLRTVRVTLNTTGMVWRSSKRSDKSFH